MKQGCSYGPVSFYHEWNSPKKQYIYIVKVVGSPDKSFSDFEKARKFYSQEIIKAGYGS